MFRYDELYIRYQNREPRKEDLDKIQQLKNICDLQKKEVDHIQQQMEYFKRELMNREEV